MKYMLWRKRNGEMEWDHGETPPLFPLDLKNTEVLWVADHLPELCEKCVDHGSYMCSVVLVQIEDPSLPEEQRWYTKHCRPLVIDRNRDVSFLRKQDDEDED